MNYLENKPTNKSKKIRLINDIKKDIKNKICNIEDEIGQELARLVRYLTKTPLWNKGVTENGIIIKQTALEFRIDKALSDKEDINANSRNKILIPYAYSEELLKEESVLIFIQSPKGIFNNHIGKYQFVIRIAYTTESNILEPYGDERSLEIASRICDLFDGTYTEIERESDNGVKVTRYKYTVDETVDFKLSQQGYSMRDVVISVEGVVLR
ncbi:MAG: hypothetical protein RSC24_06660 [Clostridium sp.]